MSVWLHLADEGFTVFAGMRRSTPLAHPALQPVTLDVTDPASLAAAATTISERVGDRGLTPSSTTPPCSRPARSSSPTPHRSTATCAPTSPGRSSRSKLPPLLHREHGRILTSARSTLSSLPYWGLYSASKAALVTLSDAMRIELAPFGLGATVLTLGAFATDIRRGALHNWPADDASEGAKATTEALIAMLDATAADPRNVARAVSGALHADMPPAHTPSATASTTC